MNLNYKRLLVDFLIHSIIRLKREFLKNAVKKILIFCPKQLANNDLSTKAKLRINCTETFSAKISIMQFF